jgi:hypothetical protein
MWAGFVQGKSRALPNTVIKIGVNKRIWLAQQLTACQDS